MKRRLMSSAAPFVAALVALALVVRVVMLPFSSGDMRMYLFGWYDHLVAGGFASLREPFYSYTPPYLYLLYLATLTSGMLPTIVAIKLIAILFDLCNSVLVYKLLRIRYPEGAVPMLGAAGLLLLPTVLINSSMWGVEVVLAWALIYARKIKSFTPALVLLGRLASVALVPFLLPKMHDRYFYPADVLSYVAAFFHPGLWYIAAGYQVVSALVCYLFLVEAGPELTAVVMRTAAILNTVLICWLLVKQYRITARASAAQEVQA